MKVVQNAQQRYRKAEQFIKEKNYQMAQIEYIGAICLDSGDSQAYYNLGCIQIELKNYKEGEKYFKKCIQLNKNNPKAHYNLGLCYQRLNEDLQAISCYLQALKIDDKYERACYGLALIYDRNANKKKAQAYLKKIIALNPKCFKAQSGLATLYCRDQRYQQAQRYFLEALNINKQNYSVYEKLANLYYTTNYFDKAKKYYLLALQKSQGKCHRAHFNLGILLVRENNKNVKEALDYVKQAEQMDKNNPLYAIGMAHFLCLLQRYEQALQKFNKSKNLVYSPLIDQIKKQCRLNEEIINWIRQYLSQIQKLLKLNQKTQLMNSEQKSQLSTINQEYLETYLSDIKQEVPSNSKIKLTKKITQLTSHIQILNNKFKEIEKFQNDVNHIKKQFEWEIKFQLLLQQKNQHSNYLKCLFSIFSTSILSYRAVSTGIVSSGGGIPNADVGGFVKTLTGFLGFAAQLPVIKDFCSTVISIGQFYLKQEKSLVIKQIVGATQKLYNHKTLTDTTNQAIIFLANNRLFLKKLEESYDEDSQVWYKRLINKIQKVQGKINKMKKQAIQNISGIGGHNISKQMNMAMGHCSQILITMIKTKYQVQITQAENPLLKAAQLWLEQQKNQQKQSKEKKRIIFRLVKLTLIKQRFNKQEGKKIFCSITYSNQNQRSEILKQLQGTFQDDLGWFNFQEQDQQRTIHFKIMKKSIFKEDQLIAEASIQYNKRIKTNFKVQFFSLNQKIGELDLLFRFL